MRIERAYVPAVLGWVTAAGGSGQAAGSGAAPIQVSGMASLAMTEPGKVRYRSRTAWSAGSSSSSCLMMASPPGSAARSSLSLAALETSSPVGA